MKQKSRCCHSGDSDEHRRTPESVQQVQGKSDSGQARMTVSAVLKKAIPLWMVLLLILNSSMLVAIAEYILMQQRINVLSQKLADATKDPAELVQELKKEVLPQNGYTTQLAWKDLGQRLVDAGAIDKEKFTALFASDPVIDQHMQYLSGSFDHNMTINEQNAHFMVNLLWALGLTQKSIVLDSGPMKTSGTDTAQFASTAGFTFGAKDAMALYSSSEIVKLTSKQEVLVKEIAQNVYRPCCGNHTAFPDCNHGMAALGYIIWGVSNGLSEKQIYKDLLALNSFWFPQNYIEMAVYLNKNGKAWKDEDPKTLLSSEYSSSQGATRIRQSIQNVPGLQTQQGGCSA